MTDRSTKFLQLSDIARPMMIQQSILGFRRDAFDVFVHTARELLHEVMHECRNIFSSFAQRRNLD